MNDYLKQVKEIHKWSKCLYPGNNCINSVICAHTVPGFALRQIEEKGHVYSYVPTGKFPLIERMLHADDTKSYLKKYISLNKIGINKASTFSGFCITHDDCLFNYIESNHFVIDEKSAFLFLYRPVCQELTKKVSNYLEYDENKLFVLNNVEQLNVNLESVLGFLSDFQKGTWMAIEDLLKVKITLDGIYLRKYFGSMKYLVFDIDGLLPIMLSGVRYPEEDFSGSVLQNLLEPNLPGYFGINVWAYDSKTKIVLTWRKNDSFSCQFISSLMDKYEHDKNILDSFITYCIECFENLYIGPAWWDTQSDRFKVDFEKALQESITHGPSRFIKDPLLFNFDSQFKIQNVVSNFAQK